MCISLFLARPNSKLLQNPPQDYLTWLESLISLDDGQYWFAHDYIYKPDPLFDKMYPPWDTWRGTHKGRDCEDAALLWADIITRRFNQTAWLVCVKSVQFWMYHAFCVRFHEGEFFRHDQWKVEQVPSLERSWENLTGFKTTFTGIHYIYTIPECRKVY